MSEHRFATGADAISEIAPAPGEPLTLRRLCRGVVDVARGMAGLDAYERYCAHQRRQHPGEPVLDRAEFWRQQWDAAERDPKPRCC